MAPSREATGVVVDSTGLLGVQGVVGEIAVDRPFDRDRQNGDVGEAAEVIEHGVVESLAEGLAGDEGLNGRIGVVDPIPVRTIGLDREGAEAAHQHEAAAAGGSRCTGAFHASQADSGDGAIDGRGVVRVDIRVVMEHVAGGVGSAEGVVDSASLHGRANVIAGYRRIIGPIDVDGQDGGIREAAGVVKEGVIERVGDDITRVEGINRGVGVVDHIGVGAIEVERQRSVGTGEG